MSDSFSQSGDVVARVIGVTKDELKRLANNGIVIRTGPDKYNLIGSVQSYIKYLKMTDDQKQLTQVQIADHLDMSERNARDMLKALNIDWTKSTLHEITVAYIRDIRGKAAGRSEGQGELTRARTDESLMKAAKLRLEYQREINIVVSVEDAAEVITEWARQANLDYTQGISKLVAEIQNKYSIKVDNELVEKIVCPTTDRIKSHAEKLGRSLIERIDDIPETENAING